MTTLIADPRGTPSSIGVEVELFGRVKLREGVARVRRHGMQVLLVPRYGKALRVSPLVDELYPFLEAGSTLPLLAEHVRKLRPRATQIEATLAVFLSLLRSSNLLDNEGVPSGDGAANVVTAIAQCVDRLAQAISVIGLRVPSVIRWAAAVLLVALASGASAVLLASPEHAHGALIFHSFSLAGFFAFILVNIPIHELAHAVACRMAGVPISGAGVKFALKLIPCPYIDTTAAYALVDRRRRVVIPAAGPLTSLVFVGGAAVVQLAASGNDKLGSAAATAFAFGLFTSIMSINPLVDSDGSHIIEAWLGDELLRRAAVGGRSSRFTSRASVFHYRALCVMFVVISSSVIARLAYLIVVR